MPRSSASPPSPEQRGNGVTKTTNLVAVAEADQRRFAHPRQTESGREVQRHVVAEVPRDYRREIMRRLRESKTFAAAQPSIQLDTRIEILATEAAFIARGQSRQRA